MKPRLLFVGLLALAACSNEKETPKGYKFTVVKKGDGNVATPGKFLVMNLMYKNSKDSVLYDNRKNEFPEIIAVRNESEKESEEGIDEVFRMLSKGDSVVMTIPVKVFFEKTLKQFVPEGVDAKDNFTFCISVKDVLDTAQVKKMQEDFVAKQNEDIRIQKEEQLGKDTVIIDNYLKERNVVAQRTNSGLRYTVTKTGRGANVMTGQSVKVNYAGYLLSGKCFDTSMAEVALAQNMFEEGRPYEPIDMVVGTGSMVQGWEEIVLLMNKGSKFRVYIPSPLGFGNRKRSEDLPENTIMIFDMEVVDIK